MNYTYRIYPDISQQAKMLEWLESCRRVYNYALRELKDWINSRKCMADRCSLKSEYIIKSDAPFPSYLIQKKNLPQAKERNPALGEVHSQVLQDTIKRLHNTWENFKQRKFGFPRFKKFGQFKSFLFPQFKVNPITNLSLKLPKIGLVRINVHRPIPDGFIVKQVRIVSKCWRTKWYAIITIQSDVSVPDIGVYGRAIGINLGLERYLTTSDNSYEERPKFLKSQHRKLKLLQRRAARCQKRSKNWEQAQIKVARLHHHIGNTRKDFHLKTAHSLCDQAQTIFAEDLNTVGLNRGMLRKDCIDASFGQFLSLLEWVCWKRGVYFLRVNPNGTSQTCPSCLAEARKKLGEREHLCLECGYQTHRDHAAAEMVLLRGLESVVPVDNRGMETACGSRTVGGESLDKWRRSRNANSSGLAAHTVTS